MNMFKPSLQYRITQGQNSTRSLLVSEISIQYSLQQCSIRSNTQQSSNAQSVASRGKEYCIYMEFNYLSVFIKKVSDTAFANTVTNSCHLIISVSTYWYCCLCTRSGPGFRFSSSLLPFQDSLVWLVFMGMTCPKKVSFYFIDISLHWPNTQNGIHLKNLRVLSPWASSFQLL